ncbi:unnamed protein product [Cylicocyclus nassatus]|uniref:Uncharacterized protein n=1 Tax=Cylicocyclus nassatus TaxID=53992 RepID=A0AA36GWC0_CYLNA|nr:unnamed protein product [Cylicocyclus nassatus]
MKCLALFLLVIQAGRVPSCVFDKVEQLRGTIAARTYFEDKNECFATCHRDKTFIALAYKEKEEGADCTLYEAGDSTVNCPSGFVCYILQRDEVDHTCQRYLNF